jgi:hypothetical protein
MWGQRGSTTRAEARVNLAMDLVLDLVGSPRKLVLGERTFGSSRCGRWFESAMTGQGT